MGDDISMPTLMRAIAGGDQPLVQHLFAAAPQLTTQTLTRGEECFIADSSVQAYEGDTALHAAAAAFDTRLAQELIERGADVRARNRRGAEPMHAAVRGGPGSTGWEPTRQRAMILVLASAGADVNAMASGSVTPLHRAVRNRCSLAVRTLLELGADADLPNAHGSRAVDLAHWTTGRGGTGTDEAKAEQRAITELLAKS